MFSQALLAALPANTMIFIMPNADGSPAAWPGPVIEGELTAEVETAEAETPEVDADPERDSVTGRQKTAHRIALEAFYSSDDLTLILPSNASREAILQTIYGIGNRAEAESTWADVERVGGSYIIRRRKAGIVSRVTDRETVTRSRRVDYRK